MVVGALQVRTIGASRCGASLLRAPLRGPTAEAARCVLSVARDDPRAGARWRMPRSLLCTGGRARHEPGLGGGDARRVARRLPVDLRAARAHSRIRRPCARASVPGGGRVTRLRPGSPPRCCPGLVRFGRPAGDRGRVPRPTLGALCTRRCGSVHGRGDHGGPCRVRRAHSRAGRARDRAGSGLRRFARRGLRALSCRRRRDLPCRGAYR